MLTRLRVLILFLLFYAVAPICYAQNTLIISGHPEYPPITWQQGSTLTGAAVRMVQTIFQEIGVPYEIKYVGPWKRVQKYTEKGIVDVIINAYKNPHRLTYMDYTEPFMTDPVVVFVKKGNLFTFNKWGDLIGKKGNTNIGESYGPAFDQFILDHLTVQRVPKTVHNFLKLDTGRVDYAIIGLYPGLASAYTNGYKEKVEPLNTPILEENFYMTFSKKSKFKYLSPHVNAIIKKLRAESKIDLWIEEYLTYYKSTAPVVEKAAPEQ